VLQKRFRLRRFAAALVVRPQEAVEAHQAARRAERGAERARGQVRKRARKHADFIGFGQFFYILFLKKKKHTHTHTHTHARADARTATQTSKSHERKGLRLLQCEHQNLFFLKEKPLLNEPHRLGGSSHLAPNAAANKRLPNLRSICGPT
jgi:hypothetical protein